MNTPNKQKKCKHQWFYLGIFYGEFAKWFCPNCEKEVALKV